MINPPQPKKSANISGRRQRGNDGGDKEKSQLHKKLGNGENAHDAAYSCGEQHGRNAVEHALDEQKGGVSGHAFADGSENTESACAEKNGGHGHLIFKGLLRDGILAGHAAAEYACDSGGEPQEQRLQMDEFPDQGAEEQGQDHRRQRVALGGHGHARYTGRRIPEPRSAFC